MKGDPVPDTDNVARHSESMLFRLHEVFQKTRAKCYADLEPGQFRVSILRREQMHLDEPIDSPRLYIAFVSFWIYQPALGCHSTGQPRLRYGLLWDLIAALKAVPRPPLPRTAAPSMGSDRGVQEGRSPRPRDGRRAVQLRQPDSQARTGPSRICQRQVPADAEAR